MYMYIRTSPLVYTRIYNIIFLHNGHTFIVASYPGRVGEENGLVLTVCACATFTRSSGNPDNIAFYLCLSRDIIVYTSIHTSITSYPGRYIHVNKLQSISRKYTENIVHVKQAIPGVFSLPLGLGTRLILIGDVSVRVYILNY